MTDCYVPPLLGRLTMLCLHATTCAPSHIQVCHLKNIARDATDPEIDSVREHLPKKKMFSFGHCPNEGGGEGPARIKKTQYIYSFLTAEKDVQVARNGGRGER